MKELEAAKNAEITDVREQLRDIMFYMEAQRQISESGMKEDIQGGSVFVPEPSTSGAGNKERRKKKNRN